MRVLLFMMFLGMTTCEKDQYADELTANTVKWEKSGISTYEFTFRKYCFCPVESSGPFTVKVINGQIVSVNGNKYQPDVMGKIWTISELFEYIESSLNQKPAIQEIRYNSKYGYPEWIFFDFDKNMADEEIRIELKML